MQHEEELDRQAKEEEQKRKIQEEKLRMRIERGILETDNEEDAAEGDL